MCWSNGQNQAFPDNSLSLYRKYISFVCVPPYFTWIVCKTFSTFNRMKHSEHIEWIKFNWIVPLLLSMLLFYSSIFITLNSYCNAKRISQYAKTKTYTLNSWICFRNQRSCVSVCHFILEGRKREKNEIYLTFIFKRLVSHNWSILSSNFYLSMNFSIIKVGVSLLVTERKSKDVTKSVSIGFVIKRSWWVDSAEILRTQ